MKRIQIPQKIAEYTEGTEKQRTIKHKKLLEYITGDGDPIDVVYWVRWPSYDFIFGVPGKKNKYRKEEVGFFQFRDTRHKKIREGFYVDEEELRCLVRGFKKIKKLSLRRKLQGV